MNPAAGPKSAGGPPFKARLSRRDGDGRYAATSHPSSSACSRTVWVAFSCLSGGYPCFRRMRRTITRSLALYRGACRWYGEMLHSALYASSQLIEERAPPTRPTPAGSSWILYLLHALLRPRPPRPPHVDGLSGPVSGEWPLDGSAGLRSPAHSLQ